jgi:hypothetical protein
LGGVALDFIARDARYAASIGPDIQLGTNGTDGAIANIKNELEK